MPLLSLLKVLNWYREPWQRMLDSIQWISFLSCMKSMHLEMLKWASTWGELTLRMVFARMSQLWIFGTFMSLSKSLFTIISGLGLFSFASKIKLRFFYDIQLLTSFCQVFGSQICCRCCLHCVACRSGNLLEAESLKMKITLKIVWWWD